MNKDQLARCRAYFGLLGWQMAALLGAHERAYWRWEGGAARVPGTVDVYISTLLRFPQVRTQELERVKALPPPIRKKKEAPDAL